jgi:small subunit ribosomal protein S6
MVLMFDANLGTEKIEGLIGKIEDKAKGLGAEIEKTDKWGVRRAASKIKKAKKLTQVYYAIVFFKSPSSVPFELQKYLKVTEGVVRYSVLCAVPAAPAGKAEKPEVQAVNVGEIKDVGGSGGES